MVQKFFKSGWASIAVIAAIAGTLYWQRPAENDVAPDRLVVEINTYRESQGLSRLTENSQLSKAAERKSRALGRLDTLTHTPPSGESPQAVTEEVGYNYIRLGENLARGFPNGKSIVDAWVASPTHKSVLDGNYSEVGVFTDTQTSITTALLATPSSNSLSIGNTTTGDAETVFQPFASASSTILGFSLLVFIFTSVLHYLLSDKRKLSAHEYVRILVVFAALAFLVIDSVRVIA